MEPYELPRACNCCSRNTQWHVPLPLQKLKCTGFNAWSSARLPQPQPALFHGTPVGPRLCQHHLPFACVSCTCRCESLRPVGPAGSVLRGRPGVEAAPTLTHGAVVGARGARQRCPCARARSGRWYRRLHCGALGARSSKGSKAQVYKQTLIALLVTETCMPLQVCVACACCCQRMPA